MTDNDTLSLFKPDTVVSSVVVDEDSGVEVEDTSVSDPITEPFDPALIRVESKLLTLDILLTRIRENEIDLAPDFQRASIWTRAAQSRLIESVLLRIPLPAFYMDATNEDKWLVVDGLQRLTSLNKFVIEKTLKLEGLEFLKQFKDKTYDELPRNYQRRIAETQITVFLIEENTPPEVKFNIFKRINTGGMPLSAQEIRHALNQGVATRFLAQLAESDEFKQATNNSIRPIRMADREVILRFLAFTITPYTRYRTKDFDGFLNDTMAIINKMPEAEILELNNKFKRAMNTAHAIFGDDAFRKRYDPSQRKMPFNKALFESWSVNLGRLSPEVIERLIQRKEQVKYKFIELMRNPNFHISVTQATGDIRQVETRFKSIEDLLAEVST
jgi:uncharacterized protein with ParB-like and HNH nuclease domain